MGLRAVKQHRNGPPLFSEGDKGDGGATDQRRFLFRHSPRKRGIQKYKQQQATHPAQWVGLNALISKKNVPLPTLGPEGAKSKGANGGVAVGLPHRNSSVLKETHIN